MKKYTEKQLVSFGNFLIEKHNQRLELIKKEGYKHGFVDVFKQDSVSHADLENWSELNNPKHHLNKLIDIEIKELEKKDDQCEVCNDVNQYMAKKLNEIRLKLIN